MLKIVRLGEYQGTLRFFRKSPTPVPADPAGWDEMYSARDALNTFALGEGFTLTQVRFGIAVE